MPNEVTFPFESLNIKLKDGSSFTIKGSLLGTALQYIPSRGYPPLIETLKEFTYQVHDPPNWEDRDIIVTNGSQDGISKSVEMCIQEGEPVLVQNPLYSGTEVVVSASQTKLTASTILTLFDKIVRLSLKKSLYRRPRFNVIYSC